MVEAFTPLKVFIENKNLNFRLGLNDGMGAIPICQERNGIIEWMVTIRDL